MYLSESATPRGNELEQNGESWDSKGELLFVTGCILLTKWIHLAFGIPLLCFQPGKKKILSRPKPQHSMLKKARKSRGVLLLSLFVLSFATDNFIRYRKKNQQMLKILLCAYLQMHNIDVICHLKSQILTDVPWIRCTLNNAFSRYHAYDLLWDIIHCII